MFVYIVLYSIPYKADIIQAVFADRAEADEFARLNNTIERGFFVETWEVR